METYETQIMIMKSNFSLKLEFTFFYHFPAVTEPFSTRCLGQRNGGGGGLSLIFDNEFLLALIRHVSLSFFRVA
jgi:hypothetical protein